MSSPTETKPGSALTTPGNEGRELTITPAGHLIRLVRGSRTDDNGRLLIDLLREDPNAFETSLQLVYQRPELLDARQFRNPTLAEIRTDFPTVITTLTNDHLSLVMEKFTAHHPGYPAINSRIEAEKSRLLRAGITENIADIELLLKILIEDGNTELLNGDDYRQTLTDHEFFGALWDFLDNQGVRRTF